MVGFGRTELSLSAIGTTFRALSSGEGFRGPCFQGVRKSWIFPGFLDCFLNSFVTDFMKRFNEHVRISVFRAENDTIGPGRGEVPSGFSA